MKRRDETKVCDAFPDPKNVPIWRRNVVEPNVLSVNDGSMMGRVELVERSQDDNLSLGAVIDIAASRKKDAPLELRRYDQTRIFPTFSNGS